MTPVYADWTPFKIALDRTLLSMTEFSRLVSVTRQTLYNWRDGGKIANRLIYDHSLLIARRLIAAADQELLPLPDETDKGARMKLIEQALQTVKRKEKH